MPGKDSSNVWKQSSSAVDAIRAKEQARVNAQNEAKREAYTNKLNQDYHKYDKK